MTWEIVNRMGMGKELRIGFSDMMANKIMDRKNESLKKQTQKKRGQLRRPRRWIERRKWMLMQLASAQAINGPQTCSCDWRRPAIRRANGPVEQVEEYSQCVDFSSRCILRNSKSESEWLEFHTVCEEWFFDGNYPSRKEPLSEQGLHLQSKYFWQCRIVFVLILLIVFDFWPATLWA